MADAKKKPKKLKQANKTSTKNPVKIKNVRRTLSLRNQEFSGQETFGLRLPLEFQRGLFQCTSSNTILRD